MKKQTKQNKQTKKNTNLHCTLHNLNCQCTLLPKYFSAKEHFTALKGQMMSKYIASQQVRLLSQFDGKNAGCQIAVPLTFT